MILPLLISLMLKNNRRTPMAYPLSLSFVKAFILAAITQPNTLIE
jgi:branched-subunit amino acid transport protein